MIVSHSQSHGCRAARLHFIYSSKILISNRVLRTLYMHAELQAADVYSFGVLCYEMYMGQCAHAGLIPAHIIYMITMIKEGLMLPEETPPAFKVSICRSSKKCMLEGFLASCSEKGNSALGCMPQCNAMDVSIVHCFLFFCLCLIRSGLGETNLHSGMIIYWLHHASLALQPWGTRASLVLWTACYLDLAKSMLADLSANKPRYCKSPYVEQITNAPPTKLS